MQKLWPPLLGLALALTPSGADAACCYFSAQNADILQPAQKVFITWDPVKQLESFTVQPKFEGNAQRSEEHTSELQSRQYLVCRLLLEKKKKNLLRHHNEQVLHICF